jgi:hypothetical protein
MFCKYCGNDSGNRGICSECEKKKKYFMQSGAANDNSDNASDGKQAMSVWDEIIESEDEEKSVEYKSFFTLPRIISLIGIIIFTACFLMPMFECSERDLSILMMPKGELLIIIPLFMLLNTTFDKIVSRVSFLREFGFFRFRLCIVWGIFGIITLLSLRSYCGSEYNLSKEIYYLAFVGCGLTIIAPFFVRENDGTGLKPIKKLDYIWIAAVVVQACVLYGMIQFTHNGSQTVYKSEVEETAESYESGYNETEKDHAEYTDASENKNTVTEKSTPKIEINEAKYIRQVYSA